MYIIGVYYLKGRPVQQHAETVPEIEILEHFLHMGRVTQLDLTGTPMLPCGKGMSVISLPMGLEWPSGPPHGVCGLVGPGNGCNVDLRNLAH